MVILNSKDSIRNWVDSIADLQLEENEKVSEIVRENAVDFISKLIEERRNKNNTDDYDLSVTPWGSVTIDIENSQKDLVSIEIGKEQIGWFSRFPNKKDKQTESNGIYCDFQTIPDDLKETLHIVFFEENREIVDGFESQKKEIEKQENDLYTKIYRFANSFVERYAKESDYNAFLWFMLPEDIEIDEGDYVYYIEAIGYQKKYPGEVRVRTYTTRNGKTEKHYDRGFLDMLPIEIQLEILKKATSTKKASRDLYEQS